MYRREPNELKLRSCHAIWRQHGATDTSRMAVTERTATSRALSQCWSTGTDSCVTSCLFESLTSSAAWVACKDYFVQDSINIEPPTPPITMRSKTQSKACWLAEDSYEKKTSHMSPITIYNDWRVLSWRYRGDRLLSDCLNQRHTRRTASVMFWGVNGYHTKSPLLLIPGNLNSPR